MPAAGRPPALALRRALLAGLLAVCVAVAGCGAVTGGASTATATHDASRTTSPPPGVSASGLTNATALATAHRRAAAGSGFALVARTTVRRHGPPVLDGPGNRTLTVRAVAAPGLERYRERRRRVAADGCLAVDRWANGSAGTRRVVRASSPGADATAAAGGTTAGDRRVAYEPAPPTAAPAALTLEGVLQRTLARAEYDLVAIRPAANGSREAGSDAGRRYVLSATAPAPVTDAAAEADRIGRSARVVVDARGRVRSLQSTVVRTEWTKWGQTRRVRSVSYRLVATGAASGPVPRPRWLDEARAADAVRRTDDGGPTGDGSAATTATPPTGPPSPPGAPNATACGATGSP